MSTPFDDITWKLLSKRKNSYKKRKSDCKNSVNDHPPLRSHIRFMIKFSCEESVIITFDDAPPNIKAIWDKAQNVYYDREFYAVRGDLMYNKKTGEPSDYFGSHFLISYDGRMGTGGTSRRSSICLFDEEDIAIPTRKLIKLCCDEEKGVLYGSGGSWPADEN